MHRIRLAVLLFLCVSVAGCQPVPGVLLDAEAIVMEHPDSAARLLEGVPAPEKRLSRRNYAHYALVLTQARWLAGENMIETRFQTSPSTITAPTPTISPQRTRPIIMRPRSPISAGSRRWR